MPRLIPILLCAILIALLPATASANRRTTQDTACQSAPPGASPAASDVTAAASDATPTASGPARIVEVDGSDALLWGAGDQGVLLVHGAAYDAASWEPQAQAIAAEGFVVLALEDISSDDVLAGLVYLTTECGAIGVTLIGASAGASAALSAAATQPDGIAQMILLSGTGDVAALGNYPKLFVASEGEGIAATVETMAAGAPGDANTALILPGDAHAQAIFTTDQGDPLLQEILTRLEQPV